VQSLSQQPDEADRLARLHALGLLDTAAEAVLDGFTRVAASVSGMPISLISLVDKDRQWFKSAVGFPQGEQSPRNVSFCAHAIQQDGLFEVEDARTDPRFAANPMVLGGPRIVHYAGAPLRMPGGERIGTLCLVGQRPGRLPREQRVLLQELAANIVQVILLREREQELLRRLDRKRALLEGIIQHMPAGLTVFDRDLRLVASNGAVCDLLNVPPDTMEGPEVTFRSLARVFASRGDYGPGPIETLVEERVRRVSELPHIYERPVGDGRTVELRADRMPDGSVLTLYSDVTASRQAAIQVRLSEQRLALAMDAAQLSLWEYDAADGDVQVSGRWAGLIGLPSHAALRAPRDLARFGPREDALRLSRAWHALLTGRSHRLALEHRVHTTAGEVVWLLTEGQVCERDAQGRARKVIGTCKDITQRRRADATLQLALEAADEASQAKSDFLATMSHEIRTPINGVIGLTQLLSGAPLPERERGYVGMIDSCARSLLSLVDNILDFSKIEAGRVALDEAAVDLPALVREIGDVFTVRAAEKDICFTCTLDPAVPGVVRIDAPRLRQILLNLLGNALKFTSTGGFSLRLETAVDEAGPRLRFAVSDTGIGIAPDDQARLFARFTQADASASRRFQGTGLGLAISRDLARLMGGDIAIESRQGTGSTFTLELPLEPATGMPAQPVANAAPLRPEAAILLVEDNEVNRLVAHGLLAGLGYTRVATAVDGRDAVAACEREPFDLLLMDCQMPEMDGFQATATLRARGLRVPILALTAHAMTGDRERCLDAGMDDYLTKPVDPQVLARKLRQWLEAAAPEGFDSAPAPLELADSFDAAALADRFLGNAALYAKARDLFLQRTLATLHAMVEAAGGDDEALRRLAHKIKGSAATIGAASLATLCAQVEAGGASALGPPDAWLREATAALDDFAARSAQALEEAQPT
jgi:PAS domain S-box-containing protein